MRYLKQTVLIALASLSFLGALGLIVFIYSTPQPTPKENMLMNVILLVLSTIFSSITGYYFAKLTSSEKVDTIAERSTEKMVHLTLQLHHLKNYLQETEDVAEEEQMTNVDAAMNAYRHRTFAAADMSASLAYSNETFRGDWLGVVSDATRKAIEKRHETLRQYFQDQETIQKLKTRFLQDDEAGSGNIEVAQQIQKVQERIETIQRDLPVQSLAPRPTPTIPAVMVIQRPRQASAELQEGEIVVRLVRPVKNATGSGKFFPQMSNVPRLSASLIKAPPGVACESIRVMPGTGTTYDFNVSIRARDYNVVLPLGDYVFDYRAEISDGHVASGISAKSEGTADAPEAVNRLEIEKPI